MSAPTSGNAQRGLGADTANHYGTQDSARQVIKQHAKRLIVGAACRGLLPFKLAEWLIQRGGMRDA